MIRGPYHTAVHYRAAPGCAPNKNADLTRDTGRESLDGYQIREARRG